LAIQNRKYWKAVALSYLAVMLFGCLYFAVRIEIHERGHMKEYTAQGIQNYRSSYNSVWVQRKTLDGALAGIRAEEKVLVAMSIVGLVAAIVINQLSLTQGIWGALPALPVIPQIWGTLTWVHFFDVIEAAVLMNSGYVKTATVNSELTTGPSLAIAFMVLLGFFLIVAPYADDRSVAPRAKKRASDQASQLTSQGTSDRTDLSSSQTHDPLTSGVYRHQFSRGNVNYVRYERNVSRYGVHAVIPDSQQWHRSTNDSESGASQEKSDPPPSDQ